MIDLENVDVLHRAIEVYELEASNGLTRLEEGRMLYNALGRLSREDALRSFGSLTDAGKTSFASRCILEGWSTIESRSALKWLLGTESNDAVLRNLGGCVLDGAFQESLQAGDDVFNGLPAHAQAHLAPTLVANRLNGSDIESTLNWIEEKFFNTSRSPDPAYEVVGDAVTRAAVSRVAELDLSEAQEFVERSTRSGMLIPGIEQDVVSRLSDQGMEVSADWLATLDPGPNVAFSPGLRDHIERWASADARAAGEWLLANTDVKGYDQLVWQFADAIEDSDPDASEMLRETVDDPEEMRIIFDPDGKRFRPD